jgi:hypothetical protein
MDQIGKMNRVLNLGAGVQSTTIGLMTVKNWEYWHCSEPLPYPKVGLVTHAVFADTQGEPQAVYEHLKWLVPVMERFIKVAVVTRGNLAKNLMSGVNADGNRFVSIPAYTLGQEGEKGVTRRQCTSEYKIDMIEKFIRYDVLGLKPGQRAPENTNLTQLMGLSYDETARIIRVKARYQTIPWEVAFPLFEMEMTRNGCKAWLRKQSIPHEVPRSACFFCPYHSNAEWRHLRDNSPQEWKKAIEIDEGIRRHDWTRTEALRQEMFLHPSRVPLVLADLDDPDAKDRKRGQALFGFLQECEGLCGV